MAVADLYLPFPTLPCHRHSRNTTCIQCTTPRSASNRSCAQQLSAGNNINGTGHYQQVRSPRFAMGNGGNVQVYSSPATLSSSGIFAAQQQQAINGLMGAKNGSGNTGTMGKGQSHQSQQRQQQHQHPVLTPSGRAFAVGGKVQNVCPDPLAPRCEMFWPDNEPLPEIGQIRPAALANIPVRTTPSFFREICHHSITIFLPLRSFYSINSCV